MTPTERRSRLDVLELLGLALLAFAVLVLVDVTARLIVGHL